MKILIDQVDLRQSLGGIEIEKSKKKFNCDLKFLRNKNKVKQNNTIKKLFNKGKINAEVRRENYTEVGKSRKFENIEQIFLFLFF